MSNVLPNGQIRFFENIPIDSNYENSLDFLTKEAQYTYFLEHAYKHRMVGATRVRDGVISVDVVSDTLINCNYMMFQNENFSAKWFFAFITDVQYVNNNMCHVFYQIDDIQTWMFDVTLKQCFVEREHTTTDGLFEHLVDEGINTSEYVDCGFYSKIYDRYSAILFSQVTFEQEGETEIVTYAPAVVRAGTLDSSVILTFNLQDANGQWLEPQYPPQSNDAWTGNALDVLGATIYKLTENQQSDSIVALVVFPEYFVNDLGTNAKTDNLRFTNFTASTQLDDNYVPKNKKLYNSPFCILKFCATDGQEETLQPEYVNTNCEINIIANISPSPSLIAFPFQYANKTTDYEHAITIENFPQASMAIDGYKAWCASSGLSKQILSVAQGIASGVSTGVGSVMSGNAIGVGTGALGVASSIASGIINMGVAKTRPAIRKGNTNSHPLASDKRVGYFIRRMCINSDTMKSIDDYFTMFGYKVNKVKTPSRRNRPHYTYLKTKGCHVDGGAPADAIQRIETIYDNGIRFWVNASEVGDFSVNNAPV